jgi:hypothetical protein
MVQAMENRAVLHGTVDGIDGDGSARITVRGADPVGDYPNLLAPIVGQTVSVSFRGGAAPAPGGEFSGVVKVVGPGRCVAVDEG